MDGHFLWDNPVGANNHTMPLFEQSFSKLVFFGNFDEGGFFL